MRHVKTEEVALRDASGTPVFAHPVGGCVHLCHCTLHGDIITRNSGVVTRKSEDMLSRDLCSEESELS